VATRESLPGEFFLDGIVIEPDRRLFVGHQQDVGNYAKPGQWDAEAWRRAEERGRYVALRWVLNPALGIPLEPFTVWRRPAWDREKASSIPGLRRAGTTYTWGGVSEMMTVEIDLSSPTTVTGLHRADLRPVQVVSGAANTTVVLDAGPMLGVRVDNPNAVTQIRGLSLVEMANGDGWEPFEIVGLPFSQEQLNATYYRGGQQGPVGSLTDPFSAAVQRIENWGPVLGWAPLGGLDPWRAPDAKPLVEEMQDDLLPSLARVLVENPPPAVGDQIKAEFVRKLAELHQIVGTKAKQFNTGAVGDRAELTVRPLQALTTSVATDTWSSLALGFGTGDSINADMEKVGVDYMVTAPWDGLMKRAVPNPFPFPLPGLVPEVVDQEVQRELATIVLAPQQRPAPGAPAPVTTRVGHDEGAAALDRAYQTNIVIKTTRTETMPREPRASGYALARFDDPGDGS
jgi:hypothetical protein